MPRTITSLTIAFLLLFTSAAPSVVMAQGVSDATVKAAITSVLKTKPPWEVIRGSFYGPRNVTVTFITIARRGPHNSRGYWPVQARVTGTFQARGYDGKFYPFSFDGTTDFQIHKNDYGDWTADYANALNVDQQLRPTLASQASTSATNTLQETREVWRREFNVFYARFKAMVRSRDKSALQAVMGPKFSHHPYLYAPEDAAQILFSMPKIWSILDQAILGIPKQYSPELRQWIVPGVIKSGT